MDEAPPTSAETGSAGAAESVVRAFLIADVRGYTSYTHAQGDEAAGRLAVALANLVRDTLSATGGELVELRGDEALCVFSSARQAVRAAVQLQARFREQVDGDPVFPLGVGIGLDAGEAVPVEGGYRGGALNLAARLCGIAAPGQILASETVASLARRLEEARFVERKLVRLKGLDKPVRVIEVVPAVALPPVAAQRQHPSNRRRAAIGATGAVFLTAALAAVFAFARDSNSSDEAIGNAVASIGSDGAVSYENVGATPGTIVAGEGAVWALNPDDRTISKIDFKSGEVVRSFGTAGVTTDLAVGEGAVWAGNGAESGGTLGVVNTQTISRLDPETMSVTRTVALPRAAGSPVTSGELRVPGVSQLAAGAGAVWAINPDRSVSRIDPRTGELVARIPADAGSAIAAGPEGVWVAASDSPRVTRIDPRTNRVGQSIEVAGDRFYGLALGGGSVWATDLGTGLLWRIEPGPRAATRTIDVGAGVTSVSYSRGSVWVTNFVRDEIVRVDARTNSVTRRISIRGTPPSVAATEETVWVTVAGATRGETLPSSACGRVVAGNAEPDVLIASDLPLQPPTGDVTRVVADAILFVLRRHRFRAGEYSVGYQSCDNSTAQSGGSDLLKCASNAKAFAATARLVGVIGPWNSACAASQLPITNRAEGPLGMVSPSTTHPGLTHAAAGNEPDEPRRHYPTGARNYVRVTVPADFEAAGAAVLAKELGARRVLALTSTEPFPGSVITSPFARAARKLGLTVVDTAKWDPGAERYDVLADRVARSRPDAVLLADFPFRNMGAVMKALRVRLGPKPVFIAGEYAFPPTELMRSGGGASLGMYLTTTALANQALGPAGRRFIRQFGRTQPRGAVPSALYVPEAAQATEVLLAAVARSDGTRASVNGELRRTAIRNGILGTFRFDSNGDINPASVTVLRIVGGTRRAAGFAPEFTGAIVDRSVRVRGTLVTSRR